MTLVLEPGARYALVIVLPFAQTFPGKAPLDHFIVSGSVETATERFSSLIYLLELHKSLDLLPGRVSDPSDRLQGPVIGLSMLVHP